MSKRGSRRLNQARAAKRRNQPPAKPEPETVDAEVVPPEHGLVVQEESTLAPSRGGLGDFYNPGPIALLSEDEFDNRIETVKLEQKRIEKVKLALLVEDKDGDGSGDYGLIPGTKKKSLYQSGAEKFNRLFGLRPVYRRARHAGDGVSAPHFRFLVECDLVDSAGNVIGSGAGACSNWEVKYRYRNASLQCPECGADEIRVSKFDDSPGFYCWRKPEQGHDGCGAQFPANDKRITTQTVGRKDNPDPYDVENTVQQMADKRAYVKATRTTHALSNTFTQESAGTETGRDAAFEAGARQETKTRDRAQNAGRTTASAKQVQAVRDRIREKATEFGDDIGDQDIEKALVDAAGIGTLEEMQDVQTGDFVKAVFAWEPGIAPKIGN